MVVVPDRRLIAGQMPDRRRQPALELVVIVAVEDVVFAVVLIVDHRLDLAQLAAQGLARRLALHPLAVGVG